MKMIILLNALIIFSLYSCKNKPTENKDTYAGESPFITRKLDVVAEPSKALEDTTISLKVTCYPKFTGIGAMGISLGAPRSWVILKYPYEDTLKTSTYVESNPKFIGSKSYTQEWRFKLLQTYGGAYSLEILVGYDSIFIADSSKMYGIDTPELKEIKWIDPSEIYQVFTLQKP